MQHVCLPMCSLTHVLIASDLLLEQWDIDSHPKRTEWSALARLRSKRWKSYLIGWCSVEQRYAFFFQFDHGFPPWRLPGTKSRWSRFAMEKNCCSLWLLQLRGEGALSISGWQCVETIEHLCWSGNCAQQCVKLILACHPDLVLGSKTTALSPLTLKLPPVHWAMILQRMGFNPNAITSSTVLDLFYRWLSA